MGFYEGLLIAVVVVIGLVRQLLDGSCLKLLRPTVHTNNWTRGPQGETWRYHCGKWPAEVVPLIREECCQVGSDTVS